MSERSQMRGRRRAHIGRYFSVLLGAATFGWVNMAWAEADAPPAGIPMQRSLVSYLAQGFTAIRGLLWPILTAIPRIAVKQIGRAHV